MGVLKILVLCVVISIVMGEDVDQEFQNNSTTVTRSKRESEVDVDSRVKVKPSLVRQPPRSFVPVTKRLNPIIAYPRNALPRKYVVPLVTTPKNVNTTEDSNTNSELECNDDSRSNNDTVVDSIEITEPTKSTTIASSQIENAEIDLKDDSNKGVTKQAVPESSPDPDVENDKNKKVIEKDEEQLESVPKVSAKADANKENDKKKSDEINSEPITIKESNAPVEKLLPSQSSNNNMVPGIPIKRSEKLDEIEKSTTSEKENNKNKNPIKVATKVNIVTPSVTKLTSRSLTPPSPLLSSTVTPSTKIVNQNKIISEKSDASAPKTESEEIVIQSNKYEELYEVAPKIISSELRTEPNCENFNALPTRQYEDYNIPQTYNGNKPYAYEIKEYPNQYVINAYERKNKRNYDQINDSLKLNTNKNYNYNYNYNYGKNAYPWGQSNSSYKTTQTNDINKFDNVDQPPGYPRRIWRAWNNNQIFIRPRYGGGDNSELYKGLGQYLANANAQSTSVSSSNSISSGSENQNTSPRLNPFQFRRNGY